MTYGQLSTTIVALISIISITIVVLIQNRGDRP